MVTTPEFQNEKPEDITNRESGAENAAKNMRQDIGNVNPSDLNNVFAGDKAANASKALPDVALGKSDDATKVEEQQMPELSKAWKSQTDLFEKAMKSGSKTDLSAALESGQKLQQTTERHIAGTSQRIEEYRKLVDA
jgi:cellobiose-specific phosphotransferase system component IIA